MRSRRIGALCLLAALAALHAPGVLATVASGPVERHHHHPGCPWERRDEPCPHRPPVPAPGEAAWAACPMTEAGVPILAGPDLAPPGRGVRRLAHPRSEREAGSDAPLFREGLSLAPDPHPPRSGPSTR